MADTLYLPWGQAANSLAHACNLESHLTIFILVRIILSSFALTSRQRANITLLLSGRDTKNDPSKP